MRDGISDVKILFWETFSSYQLTKITGWGHHCAVANVLDCDTLVSDFEFSSRYYVHFQTNTLGKSMNRLIPNPSVIDKFVSQEFFSLLDEYSNWFFFKTRTWIFLSVLFCWNKTKYTNFPKVFFYILNF